MSNFRMLICTVGGSPAPLIASITHWEPCRILFIPTAQTKEQITKIVEKCNEYSLNVNPGNYEVYTLNDGQSFDDCVKTIHENIRTEIVRWVAKGAEYQVIVDFTGGTKCMTAALALVTHKVADQFSYVGGEVRTKEGVGIVVDGNEIVLQCPNPWNSLGFQVIEEAVILFNSYSYKDAERIIIEALKKTSEPRLRSEFDSFRELAQAYSLWDRFKHKAVYKKLGKIRAVENNLRALFGNVMCQSLSTCIEAHLSHLDALLKSTNEGNPSMPLIIDLLSNSRRCAELGRDDDAVARLYRSIEAIAQLRLAQIGKEQDKKWKTGHFPLADVPSSLREKWAARAQDGYLKLGLQEAYQLLNILNDPVGKRFVEQDLDSWQERKHSELEERNNSILAHGFSPIGEGVYEKLLKKTLTIIGIDEGTLISFPKITY